MSNIEKAKEFISLATDLNTTGFFDVFVEYSQPDNRILSELIVTENLSPSYLSDKLNLSRVNVTNSLNNLENDGLITIAIDPTDRRKVICNITELGKKKITKLTQKATKFLASIFDLLTDEMSDNLVKTLKIIQNHFQK